MNLAQAEKIIDHSIPWTKEKVTLLEAVVKTMYSGNPETFPKANALLTQLKNHPDFWLSTADIIENTSDLNTRFFCMLALEESIRLKWPLMSPEMKAQLRSYLLTLIASLARANSPNRIHKNVLTLANKCLVNIVKYEWTTSWTNFIQELCDASEKDQEIAENSLNILRLLSEEVFDYSKTQMTSRQIQELKTAMSNQFLKIFGLCEFVAKSYLQAPHILKPSLMKACLRTYHTFLSWIAVDYIFLTDMLQITLNVLSNKAYSVLAVKCLVEIASIKDSSIPAENQEVFRQKMWKLYSDAIDVFQTNLPVSRDLQVERELLIKNKNSTELNSLDLFSQNLGQFLTTFFENNYSWIEEVVSRSSDYLNMSNKLKIGFMYLVNLTSMREDQIFRSAMDFWLLFTSHLINTNSLTRLGDSGMGGSNGLYWIQQQSQIGKLRQEVLKNVLVQIRSTLVMNMARPQEVLIVIDETGNPVREKIVNTENANLYETMRQVMVNLSQLDWENMKNIINMKLQRQMDGSEWSFDNVNSICWSIGTISGTLPEADERHFVINNIRTLLHLVEIKKGKENKAVVASNIMYIVGQYPRFLKSNWNFLFTVIKKLFDFMKESFPGIMDMAVNTFTKIAEACASEFVIIHTGDLKHRQEQPYLLELVPMIPEEIKLLNKGQILTFYEAIGFMVAAETNPAIRQEYIGKILTDYILTWKRILQSAELDPNVLRQEVEVENLIFILGINQKMVRTIGGPSFEMVMNEIFKDMINLYRAYTTIMVGEVTQNGKGVLGNYHIKKFRQVKEGILKVLTHFIDTHDNPITIVNVYLRELLPLLEDFYNNLEETREPQVIRLFAAIIRNFSEGVKEFVPSILNYAFTSTLSMITQDFVSYPEIRTAFFEFLNSVVSKCFQALVRVSGENFKLIINCILWAIRHDLLSMYEIGLDTLISLLEGVNSNVEVANTFYQEYLINILQDILVAMTDKMHKDGFKKQSQIIQMLLNVSKEKTVKSAAESRLRLEPRVSFQFLVPEPF